jgi:hypothetical protein
MRRSVPFRLLIAFSFILLPAWAAEPQLTIYNQNFAVVRVVIPLNLKAGENRVQFTDTTAFLEPTSVILRDPSGKHVLQILEQDYRADPVSSQLLLHLNEGKTLDFIVPQGDKTQIVQGKIIRSGYLPNPPQIWNPYNGWQGGQFSNLEPIVEVDGKLRMGLPGTPLFPDLPDDTMLKPTLTWVLEADKPGQINAELSYVTSQMTWNADYNLVAPEEGDVLDVVGWVSIRNSSGAAFDNARIKLMAGEVNKLPPGQSNQLDVYAKVFSGSLSVGGPAPPVSEKPFEEYHLYELHRSTTLHNQETKQVEFVRASGIKSERVYVYDGAKINQQQYQGWNFDTIRQNREYGTESNPDVWVMREFVNSEANHLGIPLPAGRLRFYRQDSDGQLEFTGENEIKHTPRDETIRAFTGSAFDLKGERRQTDYHIDFNSRSVDEAFEIKLSNHKKEEAVVRVVEHLYRGMGWEIVDKSSTYLKSDAQTIEFRVQVPPEGEKTVTYKAHYTW